MRAWWIGLVFLVACGGSAVEPSAPPSAVPEPFDLEGSAATPGTTNHVAAPGESKARTAATVIPEACRSGSGELCVPESSFVERLCDSTHPNVALTLFRKGTPWTRAYVRVAKMEAWYASGARSRPANLSFAEELIVLRDRNQGDGNGFRVSGAGSYDVLRWDGTCVSVMSDEISLRAPSSPDVAPIAWKRLDEDIQDALERDQKISYRNDRRREVCKSDGPGADRRCSNAKLALARMIGQYVRNGGDVPERRHLR